MQRLDPKERQTLNFYDDNAAAWFTDRKQRSSTSFWTREIQMLCAMVASKKTQRGGGREDEHRVHYRHQQHPPDGESPSAFTSLKKVLEVGSGAGTEATEFLKWPLLQEYVGVDPSAGMIQIAKHQHAAVSDDGGGYKTDAASSEKEEKEHETTRRLNEPSSIIMASSNNNKIRFVQASVYDLESMFVTQQQEEPLLFDAVWCAATLLHVPKTRICEALRNMFKVLKTNGCMFISLKKKKKKVEPQQRDDATAGATDVATKDAMTDRDRKDDDNEEEEQQLDHELIDGKATGRWFTYYSSLEEFAVHLTRSGFAVVRAEERVQEERDQTWLNFFCEKQEGGY